MHKVLDAFPNVSVLVSKISVIATVERSLGDLDDVRSSPMRRMHDFINIFKAQDIVPDRKGCGTNRVLRQARVMGKIILCPDSELYPAGRLEES